jgi:two-component system response regulator FixJ
MKKLARVIIVEDEESIRRAFSRLLSIADFETEAFASAAEFLNSYDSLRPDCIVLDLRMPGMSGIDLLRHLAHHYEAIPPVIVITADDESALEEECMRLGTRLYLHKPVEGKTLIDSVHSVLSN